ncbi:MAG: hypothetical protein AVDCRST_MAG41-744 [uncultured Corynebacteriales bacterium]|uniref:Uncharacterized protein n=1 Tax=uncultured Mycobacteriales bacterium TaxID=581187 RepID=A0A6J4HIV5_9ACTN|nr:MAG: hypothetical protein AVDCRST_MAG41-744 [uncultured Corynebacteriales bacterium]
MVAPPPLLTTGTATVTGPGRTPTPTPTPMPARSFCMPLLGVLSASRDDGRRSAGRGPVTAGPGAADGHDGDRRRGPCVGGRAAGG